MSGPRSKRVAFETARLSLARHKLQGEDCQTAASAHAALVSATALRFDRVGFWRFEPERQALVCECQYTLATRSFTGGEVLDTWALPDYVAGLRARRVIAATDARNHGCTRELRAYFERHDIHSVLDAPVFLNGEIIGVVCHEQQRAPREFSQQELDFAASVADMVAMVEEQSTRLELEMELRRKEQQLSELAKLEAVGRLARAAAHDFNNVLTSIMIASEMLSTSRDPSIAAQGKVLLDATDIGARIAKDLLVLGRDAPLHTESVQVEEVASALLPLLRTRYGERARFELDVRRHELAIRAERAQLERVLLNLCTNAAEAITRAGRVVIRVREPSEQEVHGRGWVVVEVEDNGAGMNEHVKAHLFEPYFTTKVHGTGIGLAWVYGAVRQLGGRVSVESTLGKGSRFTLLLPAWV